MNKTYFFDFLVFEWQNWIFLNIKKSSDLSTEKVFEVSLSCGEISFKINLKGCAGWFLGSTVIKVLYDETQKQSSNSDPAITQTSFLETVKSQGGMYIRIVSG